jgi:Mlc titration factor MtfA (ptsG expression regulator)
MSIWKLLARGGKDLLEHAARRMQFQLPEKPTPAPWFDTLERNVPLAGRLTPSERERLLRVARLLLDEVPFEGCDGLELTDEIRVTIAATAALLVHRLPYPRFIKLVRVLVYPDEFLPVRAPSFHDTTVEEPAATLGQAWMSGVVVLSWTAVQRDARSDSDSNVVLHEMAHILDAEDGVFDGQPLYDHAGQGANWAATLEREFVRQRDAVEAGDEAPLDDYAAGNEAEFFAVATEAFFCSPDRLRTQVPELYLELCRFFRDDPLATTSAASPDRR